MIAHASRFADKPEEARLAGRLKDGFERYLQGLRTGAASTEGGREARALLGAELVPACRELGRLNDAEVDRSKDALKRSVTSMAWGLVAVGAVGTLVGLLMSYGMARGLGRSVLRAEGLAEVGQLAAGMAHELRNPLTAIKMLVQTNREEAEVRGLPAEDLHVIEKEILRMEGRLNVFIDFARPPKPERRRVDLATLVGETLALVGGRARKQRVSLIFNPPAIPVEAEADGEQVRQLLVNLALNALDVMPRGGTLEIELRPPGDHQVELAVLDTGPGIAPRHLSRLYEPFFTSKETGLGLGLVVSQRIARDHGGILRATNRPKGGACFVFRLPTAQGVGLRYLLETDMATILVIDDESSILHAFRRAFADPEDTLETASDGSEGLELVARLRPDVVVLDLNLPDMSGLDVFHRIRAIDARIPVIFITGHGTTDTAIEAMKRGAFDYLLKPLDVARVRELVERAVEISRLMRIPAVVADEALTQGPEDVLVGRCPAMQEVYKAIGRVAPQDVDRADPGRERHGQGAGRPRHLPAQPAGRRSVPGDQLRRHPGERCWRASCSATRRGRSRARTAADRQVRAVLGGHAVPRRDRRHDAADPGEDAARAPGAAVRARRRQRDGPDGRAGDRRDQP